jgi:hypothetical protein
VGRVEFGKMLDFHHSQISSPLDLNPMAIPSPDVFEKLASFYLGRHYDLEA